RVSGVTDHLAVPPPHALSIARSIVQNLNWQQNSSTPGTSSSTWDEPLFPLEEMGAVIPADAKKPFDIRKV
ncbi:hypothetical protein B484DRAFT_299926, partial [Ochromonadaceae sp. CCMP2298]